jgi:hypothetical protein
MDHMFGQDLGVGCTVVLVSALLVFAAASIKKLKDGLHVSNVLRNLDNSDSQLKLSRR